MVQMDASVTVVIPVYNAEKYISKCIKSVQKQTYTSWQLIIVDDGSTDKSGAICDRYAEKDSRITVIHQKNQGSVSARRNGVMAVKTPYCCFCDADDLLPQTALQTMISAIPENDHSCVVVGNCVRLFRHVTIPSRHMPPCFSDTQHSAYSRNEFVEQLYCSWFGISNVPVNLVAKIYPTDALKETFSRVPNVVRFMGDDLIMTLDVMPKADKVVIIPDVVYKYRVGGGTTKFQPELMNDWLSLYRFKKTYAERYPMPQNVSKLMDYELINMVFTYFSMMNDFDKLTDAVITEVCEIHEVVGAANNADIKPSFSKAKAVREKDVSQIRQLLRKTVKQKGTDLLKKMIYRFA